MDLKDLITDHLQQISDPSLHPAICSLINLIYRKQIPMVTPLSDALQKNNSDMSFYNKKPSEFNFVSNLDLNLATNEEISETAAVSTYWNDKDVDQREGHPLKAFLAVEMFKGSLRDGPFLQTSIQEEIEPEEEYSRTDYYVERISMDSQPLPEAILDENQLEQQNEYEVELFPEANDPEVAIEELYENNIEEIYENNLDEDFAPFRPCTLLSPTTKESVLKTLQSHNNRPTSASFIQTTEQQTPTKQDQIQQELLEHVQQVVSQLLNRTTHLILNNNLLTPMKASTVQKLCATGNTDDFEFFLTSQLNVPVFYGVYQEATGFLIYDDIKSQVIVLANRYVIIEPEFNNDGQFGLLMVAYDVVEKRYVALKKCKSAEYFSQLLNEVRTLLYINSNDQETDCANFCKLTDFFIQFSTFFLVFEFLGDNLYQYAIRAAEMRKVAFSIKQLKEISRTIVRSVNFLGTLGILHFDLKPENIVVQNDVEEFEGDTFTKEVSNSDYAKIGQLYNRQYRIDEIQPFPETCTDLDAEMKVKLIDIGSHQFYENNQTPYIQSRFYRAPEVFLKIPFDARTETFSIGCVLYELLTSKPLFITHVDHQNYAHQLASFVGLLGPIPEWMILQGADSYKYFTEQYEIYCDKNQLIESYYEDFGIQTVEELEAIDGMYVILKPLKCDIRKLIQQNIKQLYEVEELDSEMESLVEFIAECLTVDMSKRKFPEELSQMEWIK